MFGAGYAKWLQPRFRHFYIGDRQTAGRRGWLSIDSREMGIFVSHYQKGKQIWISNVRTCISCFSLHTVLDCTESSKKCLSCKKNSTSLCAASVEPVSFYAPLRRMCVSRATPDDKFLSL